MKIISARPDLVIIFPKIWLQDDLEDFFHKMISSLHSNDSRVTSNLIESARQDLFEREENYTLGDKSVRNKDYDLYNLLYSVLTDVHSGTAASNKTYYNRKTDEITWLTRYKNIQGNADTDASEEEREGLEIRLYLAKR